MHFIIIVSIVQNKYCIPKGQVLKQIMPLFGNFKINLGIKNIFLLRNTLLHCGCKAFYIEYSHNSYFKTFSISEFGSRRLVTLMYLPLRKYSKVWVNISRCNTNKFNKLFTIWYIIWDFRFPFLYYLQQNIKISFI